MPELPEVETVRRGLQPVLIGQTLKNIIIRRPDLRIPFPKGLHNTLSGKKVIKIDRRGKYLLMYIDNQDVVIIHLGMSGSFKIIINEKIRPGKHDHLDFCTSGGIVVRFNDPRRFGLVTLTNVNELEEHKLLKNIGPDPLTKNFTKELLVEALFGRSISIKAALLDQKTIAGLGNIYVNEILFRARISPKRSAKTILRKRAEKLTFAISDVLIEAISAGGSSLKDHSKPDGELGYFQHKFMVYGKEGKTCPSCLCSKIKRIVQLGRSSFYCSNCQK